MAYVEVLSYGFRWDLDDHKGVIQLNLSNGFRWYIPGQTPGELHMIIDILRNEKPVYFDDEAHALFLPFPWGGPTAGGEPVGEGE